MNSINIILIFLMANFIMKLLIWCRVIVDHVMWHHRQSNIDNCRQNIAVLLEVLNFLFFFLFFFHLHLLWMNSTSILIFLLLFILKTMPSAHLDLGSTQIRGQPSSMSGALELAGPHPRSNAIDLTYPSSWALNCVNWKSLVSNLLNSNSQ